MPERTRSYPTRRSSDLHPRAQLRAAAALAGGGIVQAPRAPDPVQVFVDKTRRVMAGRIEAIECRQVAECQGQAAAARPQARRQQLLDRKSTRLNSSH